MRNYSEVKASIGNWFQERLFKDYDEQITDLDPDELAGELGHQRKMTAIWAGGLLVGAAGTALGLVEDINHGVEYLSMLSNTVEWGGLSVSYARFNMVRERIETVEEQRA